MINKIKSCIDRKLKGLTLAQRNFLVIGLFTLLLILCAILVIRTMPAAAFSFSA